MDSYDRWHAALLARRVPPEEVVPGRAYLIHARNGGIGVAVEADGQLGYRLRRDKFGDIFLFTEWDWAQGPPYGTAIPLRLVGQDPPTSDPDLLAWLEEQERVHAAEIKQNWQTVLDAARR